MASYSTNISSGAALARARELFSRFLNGLGQGLDAYMTARSRMHQIEKLNAKSDAELAAMGLKRDEIPRHVFRDILYI